MKRLITLTLMILSLTIIACKKEESSDSEKTSPTTNLISIIEIPVMDFSRSIQFYQTVLNIQIEKVEMDGMLLGILPNKDDKLNVILVKGSDYTPSKTGTIVYLDGGSDLQNMLNLVPKNGGTIVLPKTSIGPDMGYYALFIDTEGNKLGLYSKN